jgi:lycopene cyclase domain-containing protein
VQETNKKLVYSLGVLKFGYLAMILFTVFGSFWLEIVLKIGVLRRIKRVLLSILPVVIFFLIWDAYAIDRGHWYFDRDQILGIFGPFDIPIEEFLFFTVVPMAAIMTIEAVRTVKTHWKIGDER